jgi:hypothetical protein
LLSTIGHATNATTWTFEVNLQKVDDCGQSSGSRGPASRMIRVNHSPSRGAERIIDARGESSVRAMNHRMRAVNRSPRRPRDL